MTINNLIYYQQAVVYKQGRHSPFAYTAAFWLEII